MQKIRTHISLSFYTKQQHTIAEDIPHPTSYASMILLRKSLLSQDEEYISAKEYRFKRIEFSRNFLTKKLKELGSLTCTYCNKPHLIIELEGMKVSSSRKATSDHVIPIAENGAVFDEDNLVVACEVCNGKKGRKLNWKPTIKTIKI